jgi:mycoredoxin
MLAKEKEKPVEPTQLEQAPHEVTVYGSLECGHTQTVLSQLEDLNVEYRYFDVPGNAELMQRLAAWNGGYATHPTVDIGGDILVAPTPMAMATALRAHGFTA